METTKQALPEKCAEALSRFHMLPDGTRVIVGVSGGADSVSLLHYLCSLRDERGITVEAAHVNHGIRGEEAARDCAFVKGLCEKLGVVLHSTAFDCPGEAAKTGESAEEVGRRFRYRYFQSLCSAKSDRIATAHTANDNAETVLLHLARGSSLHGVTGIPPVRSNIIRPLIYCTRADVEEYCAFFALPFMNDSTNFSEEYARNRLRHGAVPSLESVNPAFVQSVTRFCETAREADEFIRNATDDAFQKVTLGKDLYDANLLKKLPPILKSAVIRMAFADFCGGDLDFEKTRSVEAFLETDGKRELQKDVLVSVQKGELRFFSPSLPKKPAERPLNFPFCVEYGFYRVKGESFSDYSKKFYMNLLDNSIDYDTICGNLVLRPRKEGDKLTFKKRGVTKTLKKLFIEAHIPREERSLIPVLADENGVVWVFGFGTDRAHLPSESSVHVYLLEGERNDGASPSC